MNSGMQKRNFVSIAALSAVVLLGRFLPLVVTVILYVVTMALFVFMYLMDVRDAAASEDPTAKLLATVRMVSGVVLSLFMILFETGIFGRIIRLFT